MTDGMRRNERNKSVKLKVQQVGRKSVASSDVLLNLHSAHLSEGATLFRPSALRGV
jgi:hypothetical protein